MSGCNSGDWRAFSVFQIQLHVSIKCRKVGRVCVEKHRLLAYQMCIRCKYSLKCMKYSSSLLRQNTRTIHAAEKSITSMWKPYAAKQKLRLIDAPSLTQGNAHALNKYFILLHFPRAMCEVARCVKDLRRWTYKYHSVFARIRETSEYLQCLESTGTCDMWYELSGFEENAENASTWFFEVVPYCSHISSGGFLIRSIFSRASDL